MNVLVKADVRKDDEGFEDIEEFWNATETVETQAAAASAAKKGKSSRKSTRRASSASIGEEDYDTSDSISGSDDDDDDDASRGGSTRFSYETTGTIDAGDMSTTLNTTTATMTAGSASVSRLSKSGNNTTTVSVLKSGGAANSSSASTGGAAAGNSNRRSSTGNRRVSFGSPIMDDAAQFSGGVGMDTGGNTPFSTGGGTGSRKSSASTAGGGAASSSSSSSRRSSGASSSAESTPGSEFESTMMSGRASMISTPGSGEFPRGQAVLDETYAEGESRLNSTTSSTPASEGDETNINDSGFTTDDSLVASALKRKQLKKQRHGDSDDDDSDSRSADSDEESEDDGRTRKSKRVTKGITFQWWKNERVVYKRGEMEGILPAQPTPKKKGGRLRKGGGDKLNKVPSLQHSGKKSSSSPSNNLPLEPVKLPKGVKFMNRDKVDELSVYDETSDAIVATPVICFHERVHPMELPPSENRPTNKIHLNGLAAQSFNVKQSPDFMSSWITGYVELGPGCIKDPECVGDCAQVFFLAECQDDSVEFGLADPKDEVWNDKLAQRVVLKQRDAFYVPPGNMYRLENHSTTKTATIYWTIIKALPTYHQDDAEGDKEAEFGADAGAAAGAAASEK